ncbi:MAG: HNH endonuclease [Gemmataceae bacterium]|nr:HNH endonuclease [Gemmataceae bacterium]
MALRLYMRTPFGRLHGTNPEIVALAAKIGRSPGALAMKASNFAALDPQLPQQGLGNVSRGDRDIWQEFADDASRLAEQAEEAAERFGIGDAATGLAGPAGPSDRESTVRVRRLQSFFRGAVLASYEGRCAITGLAVPELLVASHIIPWSESEKRRADPTNGLALNALLDRAFDRGLIGVDDAGRVLVSASLRERSRSAELTCSLLEIEGRPLELPRRFAPDPAALRYHRERVFVA